MSAARLRAAADRLAEVAGAVEQDVPWHRPADLTGFDREDRTFIATMSPPVAKALAGWLREWADHLVLWDDLEEGGGPCGYIGSRAETCTAAALAVVQAVLGEAVPERPDENCDFCKRADEWIRRSQG